MIGARPGGLLRRLLLFILLFSLCFTVLASSVQLYIEYRREMRDIDARMELIRAGYLASLERSLWDLNQEQLNVQLRGLVDFSDVARVRLNSPDFDLLQGNPAALPTHAPAISSREASLLEMLFIVLIYFYASN